MVKIDVLASMISRIIILLNWISTVQSSQIVTKEAVVVSEERPLDESGEALYSDDRFQRAVQIFECCEDIVCRKTKTCVSPEACQVVYQPDRARQLAAETSKSVWDHWFVGFNCSTDVHKRPAHVSIRYYVCEIDWTPDSQRLVCYCQNNMCNQRYLSDIQRYFDALVKPNAANANPPLAVRTGHSASIYTSLYSKTLMSYLIMLLFDFL